MDASHDDDDDAFDFDAFDEGVSASHPSSSNAFPSVRVVVLTERALDSVRFDSDSDSIRFPRRMRAMETARARRSVGVHARRGRRG